MRSADDIQTLTALLDWYRAMGVDTAVTDDTVNWLERGGAAPAFRILSRNSPPPRGEGGIPTVNVQESPPPYPPPQGGREARPPFATAAPDAAELTARTVAQGATSLAELGAALALFDGCGLKATAKNLCFYRGGEQVRLMIIGEAPGRDEDIAGKPFVGRAGQLLDKMLAAIRLDEAQVHITNIVYWRPPGNRTPTPLEAQVCRPFLERQIELVAPEAVVLLGGAAAKHILDVAEGIMRIRGKWREVELGGRRIATLATLHPAYLLRTPAAKRLAWRDLLAIKAKLTGVPTP